MRKKTNVLQTLGVGEEAGIEGRVVDRRNFGKICFAKVADEDGTFQVSLSRADFANPGAYKAAKRELMLGNVVRGEGTTYASNSGEATLGLHSVDAIATNQQKFPRSGRAIPRDQMRLKRGLHLMRDTEAMARFRMLNRMRFEVRRFLDGQNFEEVDTGILRFTTDTSMADDFVTEGRWSSRPIYLRKSTEQRLKQLMVGGMERIYELGKEFRNVGVAKEFLPEFTALELYARGMTHRDILSLTVDMLDHLSEVVGTPASDPTNFRDVGYYGFIEEETGVDVRDASLATILAATDEDYRTEYDATNPAARAFMGYNLLRTALRKCEGDNVVFNGVPVEISPLAETYPDDPTLVQEFRWYVKGTSFCGGMTELTDPDVQEARIIAQAGYLGKEVEQDDAFLETLRFGLPPCGGLGLSLERLFMIYSGESNIRDVVYFPL